jgi:hypothetical protein
LGIDFGFELLAYGFHRTIENVGGIGPRLCRTT